MKHVRLSAFTLLALTLVLLSACSPALAGSNSGQAAAPTVMIIPAGTAGTAVPAGTALAATANPTNSSVAPSATEAAAATAAAPAASTAAAPAATAAAPSSAAAVVAGDLQGQLEQVYNATNQSVVNIVVSGSQVISGTNGLNPNNPHGPNGAFPLQGEGSGFVWDQQGNIVTNNHVVDGASKISVTFYDGATVPATLVGRDPDSDLAVIKVDPKGLDLHAVTMGDSTQLKVGQFVVAIGNPYGLANTMTFGIVSALGRSISADSSTNFFSGQGGYTIPDIIQTDAPINPGNSGGVLLDLQGQVLGVTSAIESSSGANAGVGFAIPSVIVKNIVPSLLQSGKAQHPYIGISGTTLNPDSAQAMGLDASQRGALVIDVVSGGPADKAGLRASTKSTTINGVQTNVGGDVIVKIDNQAVQKFDDLTAYLARSTKVGQQVTLTVLRDGKQTTVNLTLGDRPAQTQSAAPAQPRSGQATPPAAGATPVPPATGQPQSGRPWLGVTVTSMTSEIAQAMKLDQNQRGALIGQVTAGSPAAAAGLQAGSQSFTTSDGTTLNIGGDVVVAINNQAVNTDQDLVQAIGRAQPGDKVTLTVLRNGSKQDVTVTLGTRPAQ